MAAWPSNVNNKFYGLDAQAVENREATKYKSGRIIYHKINSAQKVNHTVLLRLNDAIKDSNGKTEFTRFLDWNETTNGSGSVPITLTDIETKTGTMRRCSAHLSVGGVSEPDGRADRIYLV